MGEQKYIKLRYKGFEKQTYKEFFDGIDKILEQNKDKELLFDATSFPMSDWGKFRIMNMLIQHYNSVNMSIKVQKSQLEILELNGMMDLVDARKDRTNKEHYILRFKEYHILSQRIKSSLDTIAQDARTLTEKEIGGKYHAEAGAPAHGRIWGKTTRFRGLKISPMYEKQKYFLDFSAGIPNPYDSSHNQMLEAYNRYCPRCSGQEEIDERMYKELKMTWWYSEAKREFCFGATLGFQENIEDVIKKFKTNLPKAVELFIKMFYIDDKPKVEKLLREGIDRICNKNENSNNANEP